MRFDAVVYIDGVCMKLSDIEPQGRELKVRYSADDEDLIRFLCGQPVSIDVEMGDFKIHFNCTAGKRERKDRHAGKYSYAWECTDVFRVDDYVHTPVGDNHDAFMLLALLEEKKPEIKTPQLIHSMEIVDDRLYISTPHSVNSDKKNGYIMYENTLIDFEKSWQKFIEEVKKDRAELEILRKVAYK